MNEYKLYRSRALTELTEWVPEMDMNWVSISGADIEAGSPKQGDMIARNPRNHNDRWLVSRDDFYRNFLPIMALDSEVEVRAELRRALAKFPTWPTDPFHALAVVMEEVGELAKALLQVTYEPGKANISDVQEEATQAAAMASRFHASLSRYRYERSAQHDQEVPW